MLLRYGAKNFCCFKEGMEISFELSSNCPKSISNGKSVSNLLCVKGANGAGKTNALKVLSFLKDFCVDSFGNKPENEISIFSFFENNYPIELYCEFTIKNIEYIYEVTLTKKHILTESLSRKKKRINIIFKRKGNSLVKVIKEFSKLKNIKLRSNASIISTANQYEITKIAPVYDFFYTMLSNVSWSGRQDLPTDYQLVSKYYNRNQRTLDFTTNIIKKCDLGINNISILSRKDENEDDIFFPIFEHDVDNPSKTLTFFHQSSGTKELFVTLPYYALILETGGVLILDEFDINLHPHILPLLIRLFDDENANPKNAQMIFSTQNDNILDYMKKYRIVLVNKEKSESFAYRLDEIPSDILRNDRPLAPIYNSGKIGGVPKV